MPKYIATYEVYHNDLLRYPNQKFEAESLKEIEDWLVEHATPYSSERKYRYLNMTNSTRLDSFNRETQKNIWVYKIERDGEIIFSGGYYTDGKFFETKEVHKWRTDAQNAYENPTFNFARDDDPIGDDVSMDFDKRNMLAEQRDIDRQYQAEDAVFDATLYLENLAKNMGLKEYEIMTDSMTYQRGLTLVEYNSKVHNEENETRCFTVNLDTFVPPSREVCATDVQIDLMTIAKLDEWRLLKQGDRYTCRDNLGDVRWIIVNPSSEATAIAEFIAERYGMQEAINEIGSLLFGCMDGETMFLTVAENELEIIDYFTKEEKSALYDAYMGNDDLSGLMEYDIILELIEDAGLKERYEEIKNELYNVKGNVKGIK